MGKILELVSGSIGRTGSDSFLRVVFVCSVATFEELKLSYLWPKPSFMEPCFDKGDHYSHQVQELVALSSGKILFLINYNLTAYLKFLFQFISSVKFSYFTVKYFTFIEPPVWFFKMRLENNSFLFVLEETKGYLLVDNLVWYQRQNSCT